MFLQVSKTHVGELHRQSQWPASGVGTHIAKTFPNSKFDLLIARLSLLAKPFRLYHFMCGLKPRLRKSIIVIKPKTVEEATNTAL